MDYVQMTLDDWLSLKKEIKEEFIKASASFVRIGFLLRKAEDSEGYKNDGYDSLTEWARDELGLTATYVSRFKAINAKYSAGGYSDHLLPEFVGYGSAKLGEMLALPDEDMEMLTPEMKRSDIRALKEFNRDEPEAPDTESWILETMEIIPAGVKEDLAKECPQGALDGKKCSDILNPSGNSMKRTRAAMVAMTEEGLFVKTFGPDGGRRKISWQDFAQMLCERYEKWKPQESVAKPAEVPQAKEPKTGIPPSAVQEMSEDDVRTNEEAVAPAQKPAESKTYQDAKAMMDGINAAFVRKDWDRMLGLLEGLEPAIRKLRKEK